MSSISLLSPALNKKILSFDGGKSRVCFGSLLPGLKGTLTEQLEDVHQQLDVLLAAHGFDHNDIVKENVFLKHRASQASCRQFLHRYYQGSKPVANYLTQPPAEGAELALEILAIKGERVQVQRINEHLTIVKDMDCRWAYVGGVEPPEEERDTYAQALGCFSQMHQFLAKAGFHFNQVVRTWIYERGIVAWEAGSAGIKAQRYQILNDARRQFFTSGNGGKPFQFPYDLPPASTGIGTSEGSFVMECLALDVPKGAIEITPLNNPEQIDAHAYSQEILERGAAAIKAAPLFSRGMSIGTAYKMLLISGTASIKGQQTVCLKDPAGQTRTTLENINLVLGQAQASLNDVQQLRVYIKPCSNAEESQERLSIIQAVVEQTVPDIPKLFVLADVCRDNLLVEIEALSFVKTPARSASVTPHFFSRQMATGGGML